MNDDEIYLDWNATTSRLPQVSQRMEVAATVGWANPASVHAAGRRSRAFIDDCREVLAELLGFHHRDVFFTASASEANNLALSGATAVVTSRLEHPSVVKPAEYLEACGVPVAWLPTPAAGRICVQDVEASLSRLPRPVIVTLMAVNHETGVVQPIAQVAEVCERAGAHLHVDAVQALGRVPGDGFRGAHSYSVAAHKLRGPKGIGALLWRGRPPAPLVRGGSQERGIRAGTQDAILAAGFAEALRAVPWRVAAHADLAELRTRIERGLAAYGVTNGDPLFRASHVCNVSLSGWRGDEFAAAADLRGIRIASGSACSAGTSEPSPVITSMCGRVRAIGAVRISLGEDVTPSQVEKAIAVFHQILGGASLMQAEIRSEGADGKPVATPEAERNTK